MRTSSSTAISTAPREQRTTNSFGLSKVTFATVGSSPRGLKAALLACSTNAFSRDVENAAVPPSNVAPADPFSPPQTKRLEAVNTKRAATSRICMLPVGEVSSLSPANTVAPTVTATVPRCALSADNTDPEPKSELPKVGLASKLIDNKIDKATDTLPRLRGILVSRRTISE